MEYDQDKVDEMVLALLSLTNVRGGPIWGESVEGARLGRNGSAAREGLPLRSQEQGPISRGDRKKACSDPASCSRNTSGRKNRKRAGGRLRGESSRAIPKREEGTSADHGPSSPVPPRTRNALRLRFAPGR
jgi:hypothetical protein